jgi:large subunit ribosomal protein L33
MVDLGLCNFIFYWGKCLMGQRIVLACSECKNRNYDKYKNKQNTPERIELKKYCKFCRTHTLHKEIK